jgi:hypothetical protein
MLAFEIIGGVRDARVVVAVIEPRVVAVGQSQDVLEEAEATSPLAALGRMGQTLVEQGVHLELDGRAAGRRRLRPEDASEVAQNVDVLAQLVAEFCTKRCGLQR